MTYMEDNLNLRLKYVLNIMQKRIVRNTTYFGIHCSKSPMDFWTYREIIVEREPDVIVEIGCGQGGSSLALAHICDLMGHGIVYSIDSSLKRVHEMALLHPRIFFLEGDACAEPAHLVSNMIQGKRVMVIEDSSHTYENTLNVLNTYSPMVSVGDYFIVEDSNSRHGVSAGPEPGPYEAIETFIQEHPEYEIDRTKENFFITWNPKGYLRRVK
jgi:cephalosporin hydroxylase